MFFDAVETADMAGEFTVDVPIPAHRRTSSGISNDSQVNQVQLTAICIYLYQQIKL
jgi:hypothetical protein